MRRLLSYSLVSALAAGALDLLAARYLIHAIAGPVAQVFGIL